MTTRSVRHFMVIAGAAMALAAMPVLGFNTGTVSGLEVWLKADSGVATNASGTVTNWVDQSGKGHNGTASTAGNPKFASSSAALGGQPALAFDGTDSGITLGNLSASFPTAATLFVVTAINDTLYNVFVTRDNATYWRYDGDTKAYPGMFRANRINAYAQTPASGACLFQVDSSASLWRMFTNGVSLGTASADYNAGDSYRLGYGQGAGGFLGHISEVLIYSKVLSSAEAVKVGAYLVDKYGITVPIVDPDLAAINNANGAGGVTDASAVLNGSLVRTGSSATAVSVFYGPADGGTDPGAWAVPHAFGVSDSNTLPASYGYIASNLTANTAYYYTYAASNAAETVWPKTRQTFITGNVWMEKTADASEIGLKPGTVMVFRAVGATNCALTVRYRQSGGTAVSGQDFAALAGQLTIPVGATNAPLVVTPLPNWVRQENSTLDLVLDAGGYMIGSSSNASLTLANETVPAAPTNTWVALAAGSASNAANWSLGHTPRADELVLLGPYSVRDMTWDLTNVAGSWVQTEAYTGVVSIATRYDGALPYLDITGQCRVAGGSWTHPGNAGTAVYRMRVRVGGDFTLGTGAVFNVKGKGHGKGQGPGAGGNTGGNGAPAASHGGMGAAAFNPTYGSIVSPTNLGSGADSLGGGAVWLAVNGTATIEGTITAGVLVPSLAAGSAGSILVEAGSLAGGGLLDASVPYNVTGSNQRGGGGGRIAVILSGSSSFGAVRMKANGGQNLDGIFGAAGTIYRQTSSQTAGTGTLLIDNAGLTALAQTRVTPTDGNLTTYGLIIVTNKAVLGLNTNTLLNLGQLGNLAVFGPAESFVATPQIAGLGLPNDWTLSGYTLQVYTNLAVGGALTVTNATLELFAGWQTNVHVGGNLTVAAGGVISHGGNTNAEQYRLVMQVDGDMTVASGGAIDVTGKGYGKGQGVGRGYGSNNNSLPGASHGGRAAEHPEIWTTYLAWATNWISYGSVTAPTSLGSGGIGSGGGSAEIRVHGATVLGGNILAKGYPSGNLAGNAGGSIFLTSATLAGNGLIDASANTTAQYGGGGGRIAVILTNSSSFGSVVMRAYGAGTLRGAAGTIYRQAASQGTGRGVVTVTGDAAVYTTNTTTRLPPVGGGPVEGLKYVTLEATNYANVAILQPMTMGDLYLRDDRVKLRLNGNTLSLKARKHADWGTEPRVVYAGGEILWMFAGTIITVY